MTAMLGELSASVDRVEITHLDEGTFHARLVVDTPNGQRSWGAPPPPPLPGGGRRAAPHRGGPARVAEAGVPDDAVELDPSPEEERVEEFRRFLDDVDPEDFQG